MVSNSEKEKLFDAIEVALAERDAPTNNPTLTQEQSSGLGGTGAAPSLPLPPEKGFSELTLPSTNAIASPADGTPGKRKGSSRRVASFKALVLNRLFSDREGVFEDQGHEGDARAAREAAEKEWRKKRKGFLLATGCCLLLLLAGLGVGLGVGLGTKSEGGSPSTSAHPIPAGEKVSPLDGLLRNRLALPLEPIDFSQLDLDSPKARARLNLVFEYVQRYVTRLVEVANHNNLWSGSIAISPDGATEWLYANLEQLTNAWNMVLHALQEVGLASPEKVVAEVQAALDEARAAGDQGDVNAMVQSIINRYKEGGTSQYAASPVLIAMYTEIKAMFVAMDSPTSGVISFQNTPQIHPEITGTPEVDTTNPPANVAAKIAAEIEAAVGADLFASAAANITAECSRVGCNEGGRRRHLSASVTDGDGNVLISQPAEYFGRDKALPPLLVPIIIHVYRYVGDDGTMQPSQGCNRDAFEIWAAANNEHTKTCNTMFYISEFRCHPEVYPYLLLDSFETWNSFGAANQAIYDDMINIDPRRGFSYAVSNGPYGGWAYVGTKQNNVENYYDATGNTWYTWGWVVWDLIDPDHWYYGEPNNHKRGVLAHELGHNLGLAHTFGARSCSEGDGDDGLADTPLETGYYDNNAISEFCRECDPDGTGEAGCFTAKDWHAANADSCPNSPGFDNFMNIMAYTTNDCRRLRGHFTVEQCINMHEVLMGQTPTLYAASLVRASTDTRWDEGQTRDLSGLTCADDTTWSSELGGFTCAALADAGEFEMDGTYEDATRCARLDINYPAADGKGPSSSCCACGGGIYAAFSPQPSDVTPPRITCLSTEMAVAGASDGSVSPTVATLLARVLVSDDVDDPTVLASTKRIADAGAPNTPLQVADTLSLTPGTHAFVASVTDTMGHPAECTLTYTVLPETSTAVWDACPSGQVVGIPAPLGSSSLTLSDADLSAYVAGAPAVTFLQFSSTGVTLDVTDEALEVVVTALPGGSTCTFEVVLLDTTPPTQTCPPTYASSPQLASDVLQLSPDNVADVGWGVEEVGIQWYVEGSKPLLKPSPAALGVGTHTLSIVLRDPAGNADLCEFDLMVEADPDAPGPKDRPAAYAPTCNGLITGCPCLRDWSLDGVDYQGCASLPAGSTILAGNVCMVDRTDPACGLPLAWSATDDHIELDTCSSHVCGLTCHLTQVDATLEDEPVGVRTRGTATWSFLWGQAMKTNEEYVTHGLAISDVVTFQLYQAGGHPDELYFVVGAGKLLADRVRGPYNDVRSFDFTLETSESAVQWTEANSRAETSEVSGAATRTLTAAFEWGKASLQKGTTAGGVIGPFASSAFSIAISPSGANSFLGLEYRSDNRSPVTLVNDRTLTLQCAVVSGTSPGSSSGVATSAGTADCPSNLGCQCMQAWSYGGSTQTGCPASPPDADPFGAWCQTTPDSRTSDCPYAWDYCQPGNCGYQAEAAPTPSGTAPSPPPPLSISPGAPAPFTGVDDIVGTQTWSPCMTTATGCDCLTSWTYTTGQTTTTQTGCANPDSDTNGQWCYISGECTSEAYSWGYCGAGCTKACTHTTARLPCKATWVWGEDESTQTGCANPGGVATVPFCEVESAYVASNGGHYYGYCGSHCT